MQRLCCEKRQAPSISLIGICVLTLCGFIPHAGHAASLAVYGSLPTVENVALSPDGSRVAYVRTEGNKRVVFVATVADQKLVRYARFGEEKLDAMKGGKKVVELVTLKKEVHWLSRGETRLQMLQTSVAFPRTHNPQD